VIVSFLNQKGGVGKTSTVFHLGGAFARQGLRVLVVDNDPQASLTQGFLGPAAAARFDPSSTTFALYEPGADPAPEAVLLPTAFPGLSLLPGSRALALWNRSDHGNEDALREFLGPIEPEFDLILIDCTPTLYLCARASLVASRRLVVPLQAEDFGSQGLEPVYGEFLHVRGRLNPGLGLAGYLLTMFDRRLTLHQTYEGLLRDLYGADVFAAVVPLAKDFKEAVSARTPLAFYKPRSAAARSLMAVAEELLRRLGKVERSVA
jgi:chromosome partitioning protein